MSLGGCVFVANCVQRIHKSTSPSQWNYVATDSNPADLATHSVKAYDPMESLCLSGPRFLRYSKLPIEPNLPAVELVNNPEFRSIAVLATKHERLLGTRFTHFSKWKSAIKGMALLVHFIHLFKLKRQPDNHSGRHDHRQLPVYLIEEATTTIIGNVKLLV